MSNSSYPSIIITVNGLQLKRWTSFSLTKDLDELSNSFSASFTSGHDLAVIQDWWKIHLGDPCEIELAGDVVMYGWIEEVVVDYTEDTHKLTLSGRDRLCDLVDCSPIVKTEWWGERASVIIQDLCTPFGIPVNFSPGIQERMNEVISEQVKVNEGDSAFDTISRICNYKAVLPTSDGGHTLKISAEGTRRATSPLKIGYNILQATSSEHNSERFNHYIVKASEKGSNNTDVIETAQAQGEADDSRISRYRPLVIISDKSANSADCEVRAQWEAVIRAGKSRQVHYLVPGWTQRDGSLWNVNMIVEIDDPILGIDTSKTKTPRGQPYGVSSDDIYPYARPYGALISKIEFTFDEEEGSLTLLTVVDSFTYCPFPDVNALSFGTALSDDFQDDRLSEEVTRRLEEAETEVADRYLP